MANPVTPPTSETTPLTNNQQPDNAGLSSYDLIKQQYQTSQLDYQKAQQESLTAYQNAEKARTKYKQIQQKYRQAESAENARAYQQAQQQFLLAQKKFASAKQKYEQEQNVVGAQPRSATATNEVSASLQPSQSYNSPQLSTVARKVVNLPPSSQAQVNTYASASPNPQQQVPQPYIATGIRYYPITNVPRVVETSQVLGDMPTTNSRNEGCLLYPMAGSNGQIVYSMRCNGGQHHNLKPEKPIRKRHFSQRISDDQIVVQAGDTAVGLAYKYNISFSKLIKLNDLTPPYDIYTGEKLYIRGHKKKSTPLKKPSVYQRKDKQIVPLQKLTKPINTFSKDHIARKGSSLLYNINQIAKLYGWTVIPSGNKDIILFEDEKITGNDFSSDLKQLIKNYPVSVDLYNGNKVVKVSIQ
ncbi:LysM peptidoglycan-binding domain-containing protein [Vibrio sp. S4M6]|uniref:LysM peptidoglycan-binding domain-containing protein n=1 Tax=Vibrio sinus TaxID=2946865 RepID=UPI00202A3264|nr:LysM peptidoglycan-binding domain-containing protein [Vibrio sinus]MCL9780653.1 LysM peptidoglycan-binding domain-containing protein [Vibrio sinus]